MKNSFIGLVGITVLMSGCMPPHLSQFNGKTALAQVIQNSENRIILRDTEGSDFYVDAQAIQVRFEVNRIRASKLHVMHDGHTAEFLVPKSVLKDKEKVLNLPSNVSQQPVDLRIQETAEVLKSWLTYTHSSDPIYMTTFDGNGNMSQSLIGFDDKYYENNVGSVKRGVLIQVYEGGTQNSLGEFVTTVQTANETLSRRSISSSAYYASQK